MLEAGYSERRRPDVQPLGADPIELLRPWLAVKVLGKPVFAGTRLAERTSRMVQRDLAGTKIDREVGGEIVDFHAIRHTFISRIVRSRVNVNVAQELARHSTPVLTIRLYAHVRLRGLAAPVDAANRVGAGSDSVNGPQRIPKQLQPDSAREHAAGCEMMLAEEGGFEPSRACARTVFKTGGESRQVVAGAKVADRAFPPIAESIAVAADRTQNGAHVHAMPPAPDRAGSQPGADRRIRPRVGIEGASSPQRPSRTPHQVARRRSLHRQRHLRPVPAHQLDPALLAAPHARQVHLDERALAVNGAVACGPGTLDPPLQGVVVQPQPSGCHPAVAAGAHRPSFRSQTTSRPATPPCRGHIIRNPNRALGCRNDTHVPQRRHRAGEGSGSCRNCLRFKTVDSSDRTGPGIASTLPACQSRCWLPYSSPWHSSLPTPSLHTPVHSIASTGMDCLPLAP
ncbi:MAG: tyrosine-type recombinase/integrase [Planctomycetes bacterium]|nr:tyrosine-type recombinase/integrase [Planctomycetota bacterium]